MVRRVAKVFEEHRTHLLGVAYRLTGTLADEDAVQETWLRLARLSAADRAAIRYPRGWLTIVIGRLCLDGCGQRPRHASATSGRCCPSRC